MVSYFLEEALLLVVSKILGRVLSPFSLDQIDVFLGLWCGYWCPLEMFDFCVKPSGVFVKLYSFRAGLEYEFHFCVG